MTTTTRRRWLAGATALATLPLLPAAPRLARAAVMVQNPSGVPAQDQANIEAAFAQGASMSQEVHFPEFQRYQLIRPLYIGGGAGPVPPRIIGHESKLTATTSMNGDGIVRISNPQPYVPTFEFAGLTLDAAGQCYRCLTIHGMQECRGYVHDLTLLNATSIGLALEGNHGVNTDPASGGIYESFFQRIIIRNSAWVGAWFGTTSLSDYQNYGSHCQGNDISGLNIESCPGGGIVCNGFQGSIRHSQIQANGNVGLYAVNSRQLDLIELYFENNIPPGGVDTAVQIDGSTVVDDGCRRYGGRWIGAVVGPVTRF